jgi:hypothetical protein
MALSQRTAVQLRPARTVRSRPFAKIFGTGLLCGLGYLGLTFGAVGPSGTLLVAQPVQASQDLTASLSYSGVDPVITGSVDHLFKTASFSGPNRAEKTSRARPAADAVAFANSFEKSRMQIAALRGADPIVFGLSQVADAGEADASPRMSVASIDASTAAALDAIAGIAPSANIGLAPIPGMPMIASEQLAYARANEPATGGTSVGEVIAVSEKELWCLATAVYFEARGESYRGQIAVAQVVHNRVKDYRYPDTMCGVVYQNQTRRNSCQFSFACDGIPEVINDQTAWAQAQEIAQKYVNGELYLPEVADATHYHATYVKPAWAPRMNKVTQIGLHVFYKFKSGWLFG